MTSCLLRPINSRKRQSEGADRFPMEPCPFDVETVFAKTKIKRSKRLRGSDLPLYTSIRPMVYVVRIFGFAPYNFSQDRLVPSNVCLIFSAIAAVLYSYILYEVFQRMMGVKREAAVLGGTENAKVGADREVPSVN